MHDDAPAMWRFQVDVSGEDMCFLPVWIIGCFYFFDQVMHRAGHVVRHVQMARSNMHRAALEDHLPGFADRSMTLQSGRAGMHADDLFIVCPQCHQAIEIGASDRIVERMLDVFGAC